MGIAAAVLQSGIGHQPIDRISSGGLCGDDVLDALPSAGPLPDMLYVEVDSTGVPVSASETEGRQARTARPGQAPGKSSSPGSSPYPALTAKVGPSWTRLLNLRFSFDGKDALAGLVKAEYLRCGGEHHRQVVALGDGASWTWTMAENFYPHASPPTSRLRTWTTKSATSATTPTGCATQTSKARHVQ